MAAYTVNRDVGEYAAVLRDVADRVKSAQVLVAVDDDGTVLGSVTNVPDGGPYGEIARPGEGEFRMLAVAPEARRSGVAESLVRLCLERSTELGYGAVVLSSLPVQQPAHRIYRRLGFRRIPDRDWSPAEGVDLLAFRADLPARRLA